MMRSCLHTLFAIFFCSILQAQDSIPKPFAIEWDGFYGTILEHNPDIAHLITEHPSGFIFSVHRKTYGYAEWEQRYRYPDWGFTFIYQNMENPFLGKNFGLLAHYNWYFFKRHLVVRLGQGVAWASNPYNAETNFINNAYGTRLLSNTFLKVNFVKERLWEGLGVHAGFNIIHYSNANLRAPNNSTNTWAFNAGLSYQFDDADTLNFQENTLPPSNSHAEPYRFNFVYRMGWNEVDVNGLGQRPFYAFSSFLDKRINYKSTFQAGVDFFVSNSIKEFIKYRAIAFPEDRLDPETDHKRLGVFIGHELRFNRVAFVSQLGYYLYWPYAFENRVYNRLGLKRYVYKNKAFVAVTVKAHGAKAEGVEFGVGVRL